MKRKRIFFAIIFIISVFLPFKVNAATFQVCLSSGAYSIIYDENVATEVKKEAINQTAIDNGYVAHPDGISESELNKYKFQSVKLASACWEDEDKIGICPTITQIEEYNITIFGNEEQLKRIVTKTFDQNTGKFNLKIKDMFNNKLSMRYVPNGVNSNAIDEKHATNFQMLELVNGYYYINGVNPGTIVKLEFYVNTTPCKDAYFGEAGFTLETEDEIIIPNPAKNNNAYCKDVYDFVADLKSKMDSNEFSTFKGFVEDYISECYVDEIKYSEKAGLKSKIDEKFNGKKDANGEVIITGLKEMFSNYRGSSSRDLICTQSSSSTKLIYAKSGSYWGMNCTETYTASGDTPKLVRAGDGFSYVTNFKVSRTCNIYKKSTVQWLPKCQWSCSHTCYWPTKTGVGKGPDPGPNEDFDNCVNQCDGGIYTQKCINSCYSQVYGNDRLLSFSTKNSNSEIFNGISKINTVTGPNSGDQCTTYKGNPGQMYYHNGKCSDSACMSNWCQGHGGYCNFSETLLNAPCTEEEGTADQVYRRKLSSAASELDNLQSYARAIIDSGKYTYTITDSYLKTANGENYKFVVDSVNNSKPRLLVDPTRGEPSGGATTITIGSKGDKEYDYTPTITKVDEFEVSLPLSYVDKITGKTVYKTTANGTKAFGIDHKNSTFIQFDDFNAFGYYHDDNERKYYTNAFSKNLNVTFTDDNKPTLLRSSAYNIVVKSSGVGAGDFSTKIDCYYGVYNKLYRNCKTGDPDCPSCNPDTEICDGGIQYIYRPIDLTNIFPGDVNNGVGRNPRWNWTGTVTDDESTGAALTAKESLYSGDQTVDPQKLIQDIESKGETIYDVSRDSSEIDYEFVLTKANIRNIRKYNDNVRDYNNDCVNNDDGNVDRCKNYLDYNMSCYNDGDIQVCTSKFMDNIDGNTGSEVFGDSVFITYTNHRDQTMRKSIARCNNAINGNQCDYFR